MIKFLNIAMCFSILAGLSGCATTLTQTSGDRVYCAVTKPISWSKADTTETIREIKAQNAVHKSLCR